MQDLDAFAKRLDKIYASGQHPPENLELMHKFMRRNKHSGLKPTTLMTDYEALQVFSIWCQKPISVLQEDDLFDFLDYLDDHTYIRSGKTCKYSKSSKSTFRRIINKFLTTSGFPELGKVLREKGSRKLESKDRQELLTKAEIEALIDVAQLPRDKALIATLYESGCRRGELLSCRVKDIEFNPNGCKITFPEGKTGKRTVQLVYAASFLRAWIEGHSVKVSGQTNPEAPLWVSMHRTDGEFHRLSAEGLHTQVKKLAKKAGITKRVYLHGFRHSRASDLAEHLTEQQLKQFLGWTQGSTMCAIYVHNPDTDNAILKMNGIEIEGTHTDGLRVGKCPRCKELNPEKAFFCLKCGLPLTNEAAKTEQIAETELLNLIEKSGLLSAVVEKIQTQLTTPPR